MDPAKSVHFADELASGGIDPIAAAAVADVVQQLSSTAISTIAAGCSATVALFDNVRAAALLVRHVSLLNRALRVAPDDESLVLLACAALKQAARFSELEPAVFVDVVGALRRHVPNIAVARAACSVLLKCWPPGERQRESIEPLAAVVRQHGDILDVARDAIDSLAHLICSCNVAGNLGDQSGFCTVIVEFMQLQAGDEHVAMSCCAALQALADGPTHWLPLVTGGGIDAAARALQRYHSRYEVALDAALALIRLVPFARATATVAEACAALVAALRHHCFSSNIVPACLEALLKAATRNLEPAAADEPPVRLDAVLPAVLEALKSRPWDERTSAISCDLICVLLRFHDGDAGASVRAAAGDAIVGLLLQMPDLDWFTARVCKAIQAVAATLREMHPFDDVPTWVTDACAALRLSLERSMPSQLENICAALLALNAVTLRLFQEKFHDAISGAIPAVVTVHTRYLMAQRSAEDRAHRLGVMDHDEEGQAAPILQEAAHDVMHTMLLRVGKGPRVCLARMHGAMSTAMETIRSDPGIQSLPRTEEATKMLRILASADGSAFPMLRHGVVDAIMLVVERQLSLRGRERSVRVGVGVISQLAVTADDAALGDGRVRELLLHALRTSGKRSAIPQEACDAIAYLATSRNAAQCETSCCAYCRLRTCCMEIMLRWHTALCAWASLAWKQDRLLRQLQRPQQRC